MKRNTKTKINGICGEWVKFSGICTCVSAIEIFEDKTALINNLECSWDFCDCETQKDCFYIKLFTDESSFKLKFIKEKQSGKFIMNINADCFCNKNDYEIVEISEENYSDYFEIKEYWNLKSCEYFLYFCLKDCYFVDVSKSSVDFECSWLEERRILSIDGSITKVHNTYSNEKTEIKELNSSSHRLFSKIGNTRARRIANSQNLKFLLENYPTDIKIKGIMGTLYLYKI